MNFEALKRVGIAAAFHGAEALKARFGRVLEVRKKGEIDLVTDADIASEKAIIETIRGEFPEHSILAEESGLDHGKTAIQWIIDPLDGTTNFAHELGLFCVSIACEYNQELVVGIVLDPIREELFTAVKDQGARLNGRPIGVSKIDRVSDSLIVTGFPYNVREVFDTIAARFIRCLKTAQGMRRLGSAALDLCYVASGRFDGFWEEHLKPWDTAAGILIAREAGAVVTDFSCRPFDLDAIEILATNGRIHDEMISLLVLKDGI